MNDQAPTPAPKRRWFRFSLRGLLVLVTLFCCWLGWQINIISQRRSIVKQVEAGRGLAEEWDTKGPEIVMGDGAVFTTGSGERVLGPAGEPEIPIWRQWLGDRAYYQLLLPSTTTENELLRARAFFPEAFVETTNLHH